jgi:hypothetical protein
MVSAQQLNDLITLIDTEDRHGQPWGEESFAKLGTLVAALQPHTQFPAPVDAPAAITGRWETLFAHFGARHSAGKPKVPPAGRAGPVAPRGRDPAAAFVRNGRGRWDCDLYELARQRLAAAAVHSVWGGGEDTCGEPARYFSHRRAAPTGRHVALLWRASTVRL